MWLIITHSMVVAHLLLHLILPVIAFPSNLKIRDDSPSLSSQASNFKPSFSLPSEGSEGHCQFKKWQKEGLGLHGVQRDSYLTIMVQTNIGGVTCFLSDTDMKAMDWGDPKMVDLGFARPFIGDDGYLIEALQKLFDDVEISLGRDCISLKVIGCQITASDDYISLDGEKFLMAKTMKSLKRELEERGYGWELDVAFYPLGANSAGHNIIWQDRYLPTLMADWIHLFIPTTANKENEASQIASIVAGGSQTYGKGDTLALFEDGILKYTNQKVFVTRDSAPSETAKDLKNRASLRRTLEYDKKANCQQVPYSIGGSLIDFTYEEASTMLRVQTAGGLILCYVPYTDWKDVLHHGSLAKTSTKAKKNNQRLYDQRLNDYILTPLRKILEKQKEETGKNLQVFGSQILMITGNTAYSAGSFFKNDLETDIRQKLKDTFSAFIEAEKGDKSKSDFYVETSLKEKDWADRRCKRDDGSRWVGIWQTPPQSSGELTRARVWFWELDMFGPNKPPTRRLDIFCLRVRGDKLAFDHAAYMNREYI